MPLEAASERELDGGFGELAGAWDVAIALESLPPAQREILVMAYRHDLSQSRISDALGIPLGTIKSRTYHALRAMAVILEPSGGGERGEMKGGAVVGLGSERVQ